MFFWLALFPGGCPGPLLGPGRESGQKASGSVGFWDARAKMDLNIYIVERDYFSHCNEAISKIDRVFEVGGTHRTRGTCRVLTACRHDKQVDVGGINSF